MLTTVEIAIEGRSLYVNRRWVIDVGYDRIAVEGREEAAYYAALWQTRFGNEGRVGEELWWVELPDVIKLHVALLRDAVWSDAPTPHG